MKNEEGKIEKEITCIVCPSNCSGSISVNFQGYECSKGFKFALSELTQPRRILTTTILTEKSKHSLLPIRTSKEITKEKIMEVMHLLKSKKVKPPIKIGDVIISNMLGTGADIIACTDLLE